MEGFTEGESKVSKRGPSKGAWGQKFVQDIANRPSLRTVELTWDTNLSYAPVHG